MSAGTSAREDERRVMRAAAGQAPWNVSDLLRAVGVAGWSAMRADERERIIAIMRRTPNVFLPPPAGAVGRPRRRRPAAGDG